MIVSSDAQQSVEITCGSGGCGESSGCRALNAKVELQFNNAVAEHFACNDTDDGEPKCANGGFCIPSSGSIAGTHAAHVCVCEPGWTGPDCTDACDDLNFGPGCSSTRNCLNGGSANSITGACVCTPEWRGTDCQEYDYCSSSSATKTGVNGGGDGGSSITDEVCRNDGVCTNLVYDTVATEFSKCQFPFVYKGQSWERCVEPGNAPPFCLTVDGVKADCIIKATRPKPLAAPNSAPLNADGIGGGSTSAGCAEAGVGETLVLSCADASQRAIATIGFATIGGATTGSCGNYAVDKSAKKAGCTSNAFQALLEDKCIGKPTCVVTVAADTVPASVANCITAPDAIGSLVLKVEFSCGYTANEGTWVDVDLAMLQRGGSAAAAAGVAFGDPNYYTHVDEVISTGCRPKDAGDMRSTWVPPADGSSQAGRQFLGFPAASCGGNGSDSSVAGSGEGSLTNAKDFGIVRWKMSLPFTFTKVRGKLRLRNYGSAYDAAVPTSPSDLDTVEGCSWNSANDLRGPDKSGFVLFGTQDTMLYCGGRGGTLTDVTTRTVGVDQTLVSQTNTLQFQVAEDGSSGSIVLSDLLIQVYYPITPNVDDVLFSYDFNFAISSTFTSLGQTQYFAPTFPLYMKANGRPEDNGGLLCVENANSNGATNCPTYKKAGSSGMLHWSSTGPPTLLQFMAPGALGFGKGDAWTMLAWIRPEYQLSSAEGTTYKPNPLLCGQDASSGSAVCLGAVKGKAALLIGDSVFSTPWAIKNFEWSRVGFVIEPTQIRLYVNGRESVLQVPLLFAADVRLVIGGSALPSSSSSSTSTTPLRYTGYVDEIRFYNRSLTEFEIRDKAGWSPRADEPVVQFQFEGTFKESKFDRVVAMQASGGNCDGCSFVGGDSDAGDGAGVSGKGILVPLTKVVNLITVAQLLPVSLSSSFTISLWFKPSSVGGSGGGNAGDPSPHILLQMSGSGGSIVDTPRLQVAIGKRYRITATFDGMVVEGGKVSPRWTHILLRHSVSRAYGSRTFSFFMDGIGSETSATATDGGSNVAEVARFEKDAVLILGDETTSARGGAIVFDELDLYDLALDDKAAVQLSSKHGVTGIAASLASCSFGASATCTWYQPKEAAASKSRPATVAWTRTPSSAIAKADHTFSSTALAALAKASGTCDGVSSSGDGASAAANAPCFLTAQSAAGAVRGTVATMYSPALLRPKVPGQCTMSFWYRMNPSRAASAKSSANCTELGWDTRAKGLTVCGSAKFPGVDSESPSTCSWHGKEHASYAEAEAACLSQGARLCTVDELSAGTVDDSQCDQGQALVWTSTQCMYPPEGKDPLDFSTVFSAAAARDSAGDTNANMCAPKVASSAKMQCCADTIAATTSLVVSLVIPKTDFGGILWSSADAHGRGSNWIRALVPLGPSLLAPALSNAPVFVLALTAEDRGGESSTSIPMVAVDDVSFDGCDPLDAADTLERVLQQTVIVDTNGAMVTGFPKAGVWGPTKGIEDNAAVLSPSHQEAPDSTLFASSADGADVPLVLGREDFRLSASISVQLDTSVANAAGSLETLDDDAVAFTFGFNDAAVGAEVLTSTFGRYPGSSAEPPAGKVSVSDNIGQDGAGSITIHYEITSGLADDATSGGLHIHTGTDCNDALSVGTHYWRSVDGASTAADPWLVGKFTASNGAAKGSFTLNTGYNFDANRGHVVVLHDQKSNRIACGVLNVDQPPGESRGSAGSVGGLVSIARTASSFEGLLFRGNPASIPHTPLTEATIIQIDAVRVNSLLTIAMAFSGISKSMTVSVGRASLGRLEFTPLATRMLVYNCAVDQERFIGSNAVASTLADSVQTLVIPAHDAADLAVEEKENGAVSARAEYLPLCSTDGRGTSSRTIVQSVVVRFRGVGLSRDDYVKSATIQFTASATSANNTQPPPTIKVTAALSPDSAPLVPLYQPPLPLVPVQKATASAIQASGTIMIESSVSSDDACKLLSNGGATYVFRGGLRLNGPPTPGMFAQHGAYLFTGLDTAVAGDSLASSVILKLACEIAVGKDGSEVRITAALRTKASVTWTPPAWEKGAAGAAQRLPDLAPLLRELVALPEWHEKASVTFFFEGVTTAANRRVAVGWVANDADSNSRTAPANVPTLVVEAVAATHSQLEHVETSCVFPFVYKKVTYYNCVDAEQTQPPRSSSTAPWCGTASIVQGSDTWGTCTGHLVGTTGGNGGDSVGSTCVFPYVAGGETYYSCTNAALARVGSSSAGAANSAGDDFGRRFGGAWCSLTPNFDADSKWGYCLIPTYGGTNPGAACSFPFWSDGVQYFGCTTDGGRGGTGGGSQPWCATGPTSHVDRDGPEEWGYCSDGTETERSWGSSCSCATGFTGDRCQSACYGDSFGKNCLNDCDDCGSGGQCDGATGLCVTPENFACSASDAAGIGSGTNGTAGGECGGKGSKCVDDGSSCECAAGLLPPFCLQGCLPGWFGEDCKKQCSDGCSDGGCDPLTGTCIECGAGWEGDDCVQPCQGNTFGEGCLQSCSCKDGAGTNLGCDAVTGSCTCDPDGDFIGWCKICHSCTHLEAARTGGRMGGGVALRSSTLTLLDGSRWHFLR